LWRKPEITQIFTTFIVASCAPLQLNSFGCHRDKTCELSDIT